MENKSEEVSVLSEGAAGELALAGVKDQLRPYQVVGANTMIAARRFLNYYDMGLGKSLTTLYAVAAQRAFPLVILGSKSSLGVMQDELKKWFGLESIIYGGTPKQRDEQWTYYVEWELPVIIGNYAMAEEIFGRFGILPCSKLQKHRGGMLTAKASPPTGTHGMYKPQALVCDEIQRAGLFNHKTKTYEIVRKAAKTIPVVYLLSGTPIRRGAVDLYGPLSIIRPEKFDSYWKYVHTYCRVEKTSFGKSIERLPADLGKFRKMVREYALIEKKEDHLHELAGKVRQAIPVTMDAEQSRIYKELVDNFFAVADTGELIISSSHITTLIRLRQILACPRALGLKTRGAAVDALAEQATTLVENNQPFVVFTPFRKGIADIQEAVIEAGVPADKVWIINGGLTSEEFTAQWQGFQNSTGAGALICVIKSGASFHATRASYAFFVGCEYDFNENIQSEDRLYRMGQKELVNCYYFISEDTIDKHILDILNDKTGAADLIISNEKVYQELINRNKR